MSLDINYSLCDRNCRYLKVNDLTGEYGSDNTGGFDPGTHLSPNPAIADILTASLELTRPDGFVQTFNVLSTAFPNTTGKGITLPGDLIQKKFCGIWKAKLIVTGTFTPSGGASTNFRSTKSLDFLFDCCQWCCVEKLAKKIPKSSNPCKPCQDEATKIYTTARNKLLSAEENFKCGDYDAVNLLLSEVNDLCAANQCNC